MKLDISGKWGNISTGYQCPGGIQNIIYDPKTGYKLDVYRSSAFTYT